jgi:alpha-L-arabinofuranosidase
MWIRPPFEHGGQSVPAVDAVATCDAEQRNVRLALVNRQPERALACRVMLDGAPLQGTYRATALRGDSPDAYNDIDTPDRVVPQRVELVFDDGTTALPAHSVIIIEL